MSAYDAMTNPKTGALTAGGTISTGVSSWLNLIPDDIGKVATLIGAVLSVVMIVMYIKKIAQDSKESALREQILQEQLQIERLTREKVQKSESQS